MKNKKVLIIVLVVLIVLALAAIGAFFGIQYMNHKDKQDISNNGENNDDLTVVVDVNDKDEAKVDIIDINSKTRPYAISVNNTPVAVKVQTGLNKAYLVYEIPTEGNTSRLLALYKDINEDLTVGTIRSSRHNFIDYALESDAIFVHYGWSHYAEDDQKKGSIN